ncbi:hypothetical protein, partial [Treponema porcinum]|uniref:hypothetical protein n=1 Tax=Treponema porcinum TaxID=261392 RepID=UPI0023F07255
FTQHDEKDDSNYENTVTTVSDRLQLDFSTAKLDGRIRTEFSTSTLNGKKADVRFRGWLRYRPVEQIGFVAGNDFFTKYTVAAAYFAASDDYASYGKMAENGIAVVGDIAGLRLAANISGDSLYDDNEEFKLNFGAQYRIKDVASFGATLKSVTNGNFSTGIFAALESVENLTLNAGFVYNSTETTFLPAASIYVLSASAGYKIKDAKLGLFADFATGLNNEYIAAEKDADKNITGYETLEYKKDGDDYVPLQVRGRVSFDATDTLSLNAFVKVNTLVGAEDSSTTEVYPYVNIKLPKFGTLNAGLRMTFNDDVGLYKFSIPLAWKYKLIDKK